MDPVGGVFGALLCIAAFAVAVSYRWRRSGPSYSLAHEVVVLVIAAIVAMMFALASKGEPVFEGFSVALLTAITIYSMLVFLEFDQPKEIRSP